jgi:predicted small lipoprotein YifL
VSTVRRARLAFCLLASALALAACGKKGAPHQPGPVSKITYPHSYPPD